MPAEIRVGRGKRKGEEDAFVGAHCTQFAGEQLHRREMRIGQIAEMLGLAQLVIEPRPAWRQRDGAFQGRAQFIRPPDGAQRVAQARVHGSKIGRDGERPFIALDRFGMAPERGNRVAEIGVRRRKPRVDFDGLAEFRRRFRMIASLGARDAAVDMGGRPLIASPSFIARA